jgi:photosystem II stability/assembly factor-like uncharacterized protein
MLFSIDRGTTWKARSSGTARTLRDVWVIAGGERAVAVGQAGVVVDVSSAGPHVDELLPETSSLFGVHLEAGGHGIVAGEGGNVFVTHDGGQTWSRFDIRDSRNIHGVDAFNSGGHL